MTASPLSDPGMCYTRIDRPEAESSAEIGTERSLSELSLPALTCGGREITTSPLHTTGGPKQRVAPIDDDADKTA